MPDVQSEQGFTPDEEDIASLTSTPVTEAVHTGMSESVRTGVETATESGLVTTDNFAERAAQTVNPAIPASSRSAFPPASPSVKAVGAKPAPDALAAAAAPSAAHGTASIGGAAAKAAPGSVASDAGASPVSPVGRILKAAYKTSSAKDLAAGFDAGGSDLSDDMASGMNDIAKKGADRAASSVLGKAKSHLGHRIGKGRTLAKRTAAGTAESVEADAAGAAKSVQTNGSALAAAKTDPSRGIVKRSGAKSLAALQQGRNYQSAATAAVESSKVGSAWTRRLMKLPSHPLGVLVAIFLAVLLLFSLTFFTSCSSTQVSEDTGDISTDGLTGNQAKIAEYLKGKKYSAASIAAIMGNIDIESGHSFDPRQLQGGGEAATMSDGNYHGAIGYGLIQWSVAALEGDFTTKYGIRHYAKKYHVKDGTFEAQLPALLAYIAAKDSRALPSDFNSIGGTGEDSIAAKTLYFETHVECPQVPAASLAGRISSAKDIYSKITTGTLDLKDLSSKRQKILKAAYSKKGSSYVLGAAGPNVFDCSGLVCWAYNQAGIHIPRLTAYGYYKATKHISEASARPGDLVFFSYGTGGEPIGHIGIYIGKGKMIHTGGNSSGGVHIGNVDEWGAPAAFGTYSVK
jgi:hypothetical protein